MSASKTSHPINKLDKHSIKEVIHITNHNSISEENKIYEQEKHIMIKEFKNVAKHYYTKKDYKYAIEIATLFDKGSDMWIIALFNSILSKTHIGNYYLNGMLWKHHKKHLYEQIVRSSQFKYEEYLDYIRRLDSLACRVKIVEYKYLLKQPDRLESNLKEKYTKALRMILD